jgi:lipopolysaccharide/colanic/teichoic acid biosynthesis glycosyltransferase
VVSRSRIAAANGFGRMLLKGLERLLVDWREGTGTGVNRPRQEISQLYRAIQQRAESNGRLAFPEASRWVTSPGKRCADLLLTGCLLLLCAPLIALAALAIKLTSRGPMLFRQIRVGRKGVRFEILKLRTMSVNAGRDTVSVTGAGDRRITRVGCWLRRFKIDELPQLFNVLRGDMSLVGPRPLVPQQNPPLFPCRPGLTGPGSLAFRHQERALCAAHAEHLAQIHDDVLVPARFGVDRKYMRGASLFSDLRIVGETALVVSGLKAATRYDVDIAALIAGYLGRAAGRRQHAPLAAKGRYATAGGDD